MRAGMLDVVVGVSKTGQIVYQLSVCYPYSKPTKLGAAKRSRS
jgi:hypothetical protein